MLSFWQKILIWVQNSPLHTMLKNKNVTLAIIIKFCKLSHCFQGVLSVTNAKGHLKGILKLPVAWKNVSI